MVREPLVLDACCALTLCAAGEMHGILNVLPYSFRIGARARSEVQWLKTEEPGVRDKVDLAPLVDVGLLQEHSLAGNAELARFVALSSRMDDGEAEAAAIAIERGWLLATDDRKIRRVLATEFAALKVLGTSDLLRQWQAASGLSDTQCGKVIRRVMFRATFAPPRSDPHYAWWVRLAHLPVEEEADADQSGN